MSMQAKERRKLSRTPLWPGPYPISVNKVELLAAAVTAGIVIAVVLYYSLSLKPIHDRVIKARALQEGIQKDITELRKAPAGPNAAEGQVKAAKASLDDFEEHMLRPMLTGRIEVINDINELVKADGLHLGSGLDMRMANKGRPAASEDSATDSSNKSDPKTTGSRAKDNPLLELSRHQKPDALDVFPKVQLRFSVVGGYENIRKFMRDLQDSKDFLVVDSIVLADVEPKFGRGVRGASTAGVAGGVGLTASVTAYFRPN